MSKNKYLDDNSVNDSYNDSGLITPKSLIVGSALLAGSIIGYRKGLFKPLIKEAMELSANYSPGLSLAFNDMRKWINSDEAISQSSIFRMDLKNLLHQIKNQDADVAKEIIDATREDLSLYFRRLNMSLDDWEKGIDKIEILNDWSNTDMLNKIKRANIEIGKYSDANTRGKFAMLGKSYEAILNGFHKTDDQLNEQLIRNGFRSATFDDLFDSHIDKNGAIRLKEKTKFYFSDKKKKNDFSSKDNLERLLNHFMIDDTGAIMSVGGKKARMKDKFNLKNLILDENILIDETGNLIDLRTRNREFKESVRNLANEWKIPFININPLQMFGLGKYGQTKVSVGTITEDMIAAPLTGKYGNTVDNVLGNVKNEAGSKLKDIQEGVTIIDGDVFTMTPDGGIRKIDYKHKKDITFISKKMSNSTSPLSRTQDSQRIMMGIKSRHFTDYTENDGDKYVAQKIAKFFDVGRQDKDISKGSFAGILEASNPDGYIENFISKITSKTKPYSGVDIKDNFVEMIKPLGKHEPEDIIFVTNRAITLKDLKVNKFNQEIVMDYAKQYFANFKKDYELVNEKTGVAHYIIERMNTAISSVGLGTSIDSHSGPVSGALNLIGKRFLPIYGAYQGWNLLNAITEGEDENGQRTNLNRGFWEAVSRFDIGVSKINDAIGVTSFAKNIAELMPGYDQIEELPFVKSLNLHESAEERIDYWEYGKDAVRKGRYWSLNSSTAFTGGKVSYFKMNPLQAAKADARYSDSQFGSRREYFSSILNPYHYDNKHYYDRPYLMTSPAFENVPIFGPTLGSTVGKLFKPQVRMHKEYWNEDNSVKTSQQIDGENVIANIEQQRMVSAGVANVMMKESGQTVQEVYSNTFTDRLKEITLSAKETAIKLIKFINSGIQKIDNSFAEWRAGKSNYTVPQYNGNLNVEKAMLNATEPYSHAIENKRKRKVIDDSVYYETVKNHGVESVTNDFANNISTSIIGDSVINDFGDGAIVREFKDAYFANVRPFIPKVDYSSKQIKLPSNLSPSHAMLGDTVLVNSNIAISSSSEISSNYNYHQASRANDMTSSSYQDVSGAKLGKTRNFETIKQFDEEFDLSNQSMIYRTGSGKLSVVNTGQEIDPLTSVNVNNESAKSFIGAPKNHSITDNYLINDNSVSSHKEEYIENPNGFTATIKRQTANTLNVAGIYGFGFDWIVTGGPQDGSTVIDTPGYSRSFNKIFWDQELGGFGGDISEIFRRLVQKRDNGVHYYNPIRNTMPEWMPGKDGFIDFQHGDPYSKIANGEERLPGHGFERAYGIDINNYRVGSSAMGRSKEELIAKFLEKDDITEEWQQDIVNKGTRIHEKVEEYMVRNHVAIDTEKEIYDPVMDVIGYYDAKIHDSTSQTGERIIDIKTISDKGFEEVVSTGTAKEEHIKQVNWYLHHDNKNSKGGVLYVNRNNPNQMYMTEFNYSKRLYQESMKNVSDARSEVQQAIASGQISRAERYKPIDKLRILGDVAPYSQEYDDMLKYVRGIDLDDGQKAEVQRIEDMVAEQRKPLRTYEYRFTTADVVKSKVKVKRKIDDNKFMTDKFDNPIKLAGVELPSKSSNEELHSKAMDFINKNVRGNIEIKIAKDEHVRVNKDSLQTMNAVVYANGMNINRELIKRGLAEEKKDDYSAAGVHARFNSLERNFGAAWETIAHQNTMVNDKILRVRSAKEDYERQEIYNKDFKDWKKPISDFLIPMMWKAGADESMLDRAVGVIGGAAIGSFFGGGIGSGSLKSRVIGATIGVAAGSSIGTAIATGALVGSMFGGIGKSGSPFGKLIGAAVGVSGVMAAKAHKMSYEAKTGEKWKPKLKRREEEVLDYLDKLEFVKNRRLYEAYAQKALREDGIDVKKIIKESKEKADSNKAWGNKINKIKREQKKTGKFDAYEFEKAGLKFDPNDKKHYKKRNDKSNNAQLEDIKKRKDSIKKEKAILKKELQELNKAKIEKARANNLTLPHQSVFEQENAAIRKRKQKIKEKEKNLKKANKEFSKDSKNRKQTALDRTVNRAINNAKTKKEMMIASPNAMKAIEYYNKAEATMYGYDAGEEVSTFVSALPKKDRKYFNQFLKAGEKERKEILKIAPKYMKRALQSSYGVKVDEKESLIDYFNEHYLPGENWDGWQEGMDFDAIKTKVISREGFNLARHDVWEDNKIKADAYGEVPLPNMDYKTGDIQKVKLQLENVLGEAGYQDLDITVSHGNSSPSINLDLYEDRKEEFESKIREKMRR